MKTIALASILGAAHSAKVTCHFTADNYIHEVYVDGVDKIKAGEVKGALTGWTKQKTVEFDSSATTLAVHASDAERGCRNGGFIMQCTTDDSSSPWNMDTQNSRAFFEVASKRLNHKGHAALQNQAPPSTNWMKTDYETDHAVWETPRQTNHRWMRGSRWGGIDINGGICSGESQNSQNNNWWYRFQVDKVKCHFTADNYVHYVYVDGEKVNDQVDGNMHSWVGEKTVSFSSNAESLAIQASDNEAGCRNGGFIMQCRTPVKDSPWNMNTQNNRETFVVASSKNHYRKGAASNMNQSPPHADWAKKDFQPTDRKWDTPRKTSHRWMRGSRWGGIDINGGICSGESQSTYNNVWWLRYNINTVKCDLTADNYVHKIYIDGEDMKHSVFGSMNDWTNKKYIRFDSSAKSIAVHASDAERGCRNGGFMMACSTPVKTSVWNTNTEANIADFTVASKKMNHKGRHALENAAPPAANWYKNDYYAIGKQWDTPRRTSHHWMRNRGININHGICAGKSQDSTNNNWWIRLEHKTEGHPSNCLEWDCTAWCKYFSEEDEANNVYSDAGCGIAGEADCNCDE